MSASPAKTPAAVSATSTPTASGPHIRKKAPVSIFTHKKNTIKRKPQPARQQAAQAPTNPSSSTTNTHSDNSVAIYTDSSEDKGYTDYPIVLSKDSLLQGLHYHALKFHNRADHTHNNSNVTTRTVNPYDETQFPRPVRLHRRSARDKLEPPPGDQSDAASGLDDKDRELNTLRRLERQAEREANQALIAPTAEVKKMTRKKPQKKLEDVYFDENNAKQSQRAKLRYEEARPWHLEDASGKNVWVGSYEEPLTETSVMFEITPAAFKMVPVEKWYRFVQTNRVQAMDSDAVEKYMARKVRAPRWFMGMQAEGDAERRRVALARREMAIAMQRQQRGRDRDDEFDGPAAAHRDDYQADVDEIDFEFNDEFQDDDEGGIFGVEENDETKEIEKRIREEMRGANLAGTGVKDEDRDWDAEEAKEKAREHAERKLGKRIRKGLIKKEGRKFEYDSDDSRGEFDEESESEDSEEERERLQEEERKLEEAKKQLLTLENKSGGASTRGTNTPSGRSEKRDRERDLSRSNLAATLKRPGSPDLSEMSGNESSRNRKKMKGVNGHATAVNGPQGARSLSRKFTHLIQIPFLRS